MIVEHLAIVVEIAKTKIHGILLCAIDPLSIYLEKATIND
jgi:hypothetical protein